MARQPDDTLDRLLTRTLRSHTAGGEVCPSAEDIAAYLERSLDVEEAQRIELHLSSCARCAEALATLVDTEPVAAPVAPADAWWSWRTWRWAVRATAVLVLGIWFAGALREEGAPATQMARTETAPTEIATAKKEAPQQESAASAVAPPPSPISGFGEARPAGSVPAEARVAADLQQSSELSASEPAHARARAAGSLPQAQQELAPPPREAKEQAVAARERDAANTAAVPQPSRPAVVAPGLPEALTKSETRAEPPSAGARRDAQAEARGITAPTSSAVVDAAQSQGAATATFSAAAPLLLRARAGNVMWRIAGSVIERSVDGGRAWATEFRTVNPVRAGVVAADDTVWLVGPGGLVLQRLPTAAWRVVPAPVMDDLVSLSDASATGITVRTANGRQFRTTDNGATWIVK